MKKLLTLLLLSLVGSTVAFGQSNLTETQVLGNWKMVIELDEVMDELKKEAEDSESIFAEVLLKSVAGVVEGVLDRVNIYVEFKQGGTAVVMVDAFDEDSDRDKTNWYVKNGRLYMEDTDKFNNDMDGYWVMKDGVLFLEGTNKEKAKIYMVRVN